MFKTQEKQYEVDGFLFAGEEEANQAKKEWEGVKYIRGKVDMEQPKQVFEIYNRMIKENMFSTAVGMSYLRDLQEYLITIGYVKKEEIRPIPVSHPKAKGQAKEMKQKKKQNAVTDQVIKKRYQLSFCINVVLLICVLMMFAISATSSHPNILNYETKIIDRYSAWEQELNEREEALRELENK